ncbi:MAG TPA: CAP domain-containing protein [Candidatus Saccharibacteria bacterium]|nr:CAP domain-containing protein [Candidatus Saccharibacteria bacterium]
MSHQRGAKTKKNKNSRVINLQPKTKLHSNLRPKNKQSKQFLKTYYPYLPLLSILFIILAIIQPWRLPNISNGVLSYATNMSVNGLLDSTNTVRQQNDKKPLEINKKLTSAAQAKAEDMVEKDYWSHDTPNGQAPWVFINKFDYTYQKAGENLAYGFSAPTEVLAGWLNSPSHRENVLDNNYQDVGFGFANSSNFQKSGPTTIVVAMYGTSTKSSDGTFSTTKPSANSYSTTLGSKTVEVKNVGVSRLQAFAGYNLPWLQYLVVFIIGGSITYLFVKHSVAIKRTLKRGEKFVIKNPLLDITLIALVALCILVSQRVGYIL